jgi:hypothetical protein
MLQTQGFTASQLTSLTDEINRWLVTNTKEMDTKFRLINIKYAAIGTGEVVSIWEGLEEIGEDCC